MTTKIYHIFLKCRKRQLRKSDTLAILGVLCKIVLISLSSSSCQNEKLGSIYPKTGRVCQRFSSIIDGKSSVFRQQCLKLASTPQHAKILMPLQNMSKESGPSSGSLQCSLFGYDQSSFIQIQNTDSLHKWLKLGVWPVTCKWYAIKQEA